VTEEEARCLLLMRAVESADPAQLVLTREDRLQATSAGMAAPQRRSGRQGARAEADDEAFLVQRAQFAFARITSRFPEAGRAAARLRWPRWIDWLLPACALALGLTANELDNGRRLNILTFPLIGMVLWNLAVFASLGVNSLRRLVTGSRRSAGPNALARLLMRLAGWGQTHGASEPLRGALGQFSGDWLRYASPLTYSRASRALHLAAAALAGGVVLGMYLRALAIEYQAGWESTFLGAGTVHGLLHLVLGPASAISGIPLPGRDELLALRWSEPRPGENAGPWIHLYALTAAVFIIAPRLMLAVWHSVWVLRRSRRFPIPGAEDFYIRQLMRTARGGGGEVRVLPYSFRPPEPTCERLGTLLRRILGEGTRIRFDNPVDYGGEDEWLARFSPERELDHLVVLFNLAATPERENHGALIVGIRRRLAAHPHRIALTVLVDEAAYRDRLGRQATADGRLKERRSAWETVLGREGVHPTSVNLGEPDPAALTQLLEGALVKDPALIGGSTA